MYVPRYMVFTKGVGVAKEKLSSFENALRDARIAHLNLVTVSSIFPPHCNIIDIEKGIDGLSDSPLARHPCTESAVRHFPFASVFDPIDDLAGPIGDRASKPVQEERFDSTGQLHKHVRCVGGAMFSGSFKYGRNLFIRQTRNDWRNIHTNEYPFLGEFLDCLKSVHRT